MDPDGTIAKGLAANVERVTQQTNLGLGFNADGSSMQNPQISMSSAYQAVETKFSVALP